MKKNLILLFKTVTFMGLVAFFSLSCEKETTTVNEAETMLSSYNKTHPTIEGVISLSDVNCDVVDGKLSFENAYEFRKALNAVRNASEADVVTWLSGKGFHAHFNTYLDATMMIEDDTAIPMKDVLAAYPGLLEEDDAIRANSPNITYAMLTNDAGEVLVNNDLNVFRKAYHIMVDNADPVLYSEALATMESREDEGVFVTLIEQHYVNDAEKTAFKFYNSCPIAGPSSLAHRITRKTGGTNRRMICEIQQLNVALSVSFMIGGRIYDYSFETNLIVENERKSGFHWINTYPDFTIDNGSGDIISVNRLLQGINLRNNFPLLPVNYMGTASDGNLNTSFFGIADLVHPIDEEMGTVDFSLSGISCPDCILNFSFYSILDGRANVTWDNHDTGMSIELGCQ